MRKFGLNGRMQVLPPMPVFAHDYAFDPSYGYSQERLLSLAPPQEPSDYETFWQGRYQRALALDADPIVLNTRISHPDFVIYKLKYRSTDEVIIRGWMLTPHSGKVERVVVVGHGYGGREGPDFELSKHGTAWLFPCLRGLSQSRLSGVSENPAFHVLHHIENPHLYILGGCVEDIWLCVSAAIDLFPHLSEHVGYAGTSFGGGLGAMALAWDQRVRKAHLNVPSFGHQALRLTLPTIGSGASVIEHEQKHGHVMETLQYFDAAVAARHIGIPILFAGALFDPAVAPPGQFAIFNALTGPKELFLLEAGHFEYPHRVRQEIALRVHLEAFFEDL